MGGYDKGDDERKSVSLSKEREDLTYATAHDFADGNLFAAVLGLEQCEAEDTDEGYEDADESKEFDLTNEAELISICLLQTIVEEIERVLLVGTEPIEDISSFLLCLDFVITSFGSDEYFSTVIAPVFHACAIDDECQIFLAAVDSHRGELDVLTYTYDMIGYRHKVGIFSSRS